MTSRAPISLMVVDPDRRIQQACDETFAQIGYRVRGVDTAEDALDELRRQPVSALITELVLAGMDGLTLIRLARREDAELTAVVLTGRPSASSAARALRMRVDDYVLKDADSLGHLRRTVWDALRRRAQRSETARLLGELALLNDDFLIEMADLQRANLELEAEVRPTAPRGSTFRVLVVDDDPSTVSVISAALLRTPGLHVQGAYSAAVARAIVEAEPFDLVLMDLHLGADDGLETIAELRARRPTLVAALMTGYASLDSAVAAVEKGVVAYLRKPFDDLDTVTRRVDEIRAKVESESRNQRYLQAFRERNADFLSRYRLLKAKLATLQSEPA